MDDAELPGDELPVERFQGTWKVERIAADATAPDGFKPDASWIGRRMRYDDTMLGWVGPDGAILAQDRCPDPMFSIVWTIGNVRMLAPPFRPAWTALDIPLESVGPPHQWICDTPEYTSFGPDEGVVFPVGTDQLLLSWRDHMILLLRRVKGP